MRSVVVFVTALLEAERAHGHCLTNNFLAEMSPNDGKVNSERMRHW